MQTKNVAQKGKIPYKTPIVEVEKFVADLIRTSGDTPLAESQTTSFTQWNGSWD